MLLHAVLTGLLAVLALSLAVCSGHARPASDSFETLLHQGFELHQKKEYSSAIPVLQDAWKLRPRDYFANLLLGIDLLRTGRVKEAIPRLQEAARQKPKEEFAYEYLGESFAALEQHAEAFDSFRKAMETAPDSAEAKSSFVGFCLARFADLSDRMRSSKDGLAAEYRLEALSRKSSDPTRIELLQRAAALEEDPENWAQLALTQIQTGDVAAGRAALEHARKLAPDDLHVLKADALLAAEEGDWPRAARSLNAVASRSPAALARLVVEWPGALRPPQPGEVSGAAASFLGCVTTSCGSEALLRSLPKPMDPPHASAEALVQQQRWESVTRRPAPARSQKEAWLERGVAWAEIGNCKEALPALERGFSAQENAAPAMFHLSQCYAEEADRIAAQLAKSGGNQAAVRLMRGDVLLRLQANSRGAAAEYQAAVTERPDDPVGWERLAEAQLAAGSTEEARHSAREALKIDAHRLAAMRTLAQAAMEERQYAEALPFLRELAKQNPRDLTTRVQLATTCSQTGAVEDALKYLGSALKLGYPDEKGSLHYQLGTILKRLGRAAEADQAFREARELSDHFQNTSLRGKEPKE